MAKVSSTTPNERKLLIEIYDFFKKDVLTVMETIEYLGCDTLPTEISIHNNTVMIRDLAKYLSKF